METEKNCCSGRVEPVSPAPAAEAVRPPEAGQEKAAPLSVGDYIVMFIVFALPLVNLILALVWGFGSGINPNRKNFAKAWLVMLLIGFIAGILMAIVGGLLARNLIPMIQELFEGFQG